MLMLWKTMCRTSWPVAMSMAVYTVPDALWNTSSKLHQQSNSEDFLHYLETLRLKTWGVARSCHSIWCQVDTVAERPVCIHGNITLRLGQFKRDADVFSLLKCWNHKVVRTGRPGSDLNLTAALETDWMCQSRWPWSWVHPNFNQVRFFPLFLIII